MAYDVAAIRSQFPALLTGDSFFDGPGGTQTPEPVIGAIAEALANPLANRGIYTSGERNAEFIVRNARAALADFLHAEPAGIVFGRSATQLAYDFSRMLARNWSPGDEVVVTRLDHDSNIRPWITAAERAGAVVRMADFDPQTAELSVEALAACVNDRTRLVAVTAASNLVGTMPDIPAIAALAHRVGAQLWVDGVHYSAHALVDIQALGADFFVCSPYKFLGPHHGVLAADPALLESLQPDKLLPSTNAVPERFELGTLPYELLAGSTAAVDFLAGLDAAAQGTRRERLAASSHALEQHEAYLRALLERGLAAIPEVVVHSRAARRTPTTLITLNGHDAASLYHFLAGLGVNAPAGSFYALEASRHLGLGDTGGLRIGLAPYNDEQDIERLMEGIHAFLRSR